MSEYASFEDLMANPMSQETQDVELNNGMVVKVRGLTRYEYMMCGKNMEGDSALFERRALMYGIVEPSLSLGQVESWQKSVGFKVVAPVQDAIMILSGVREDADKSDVS